MCLAAMSCDRRPRRTQRDPDPYAPGLRDSVCHGHQQPRAPGELCPSPDALTASPSPPCPSVQAITRRVLAQDAPPGLVEYRPGLNSFTVNDAGVQRLPGETIEPTNASPFSAPIPAPRPTGRANRRAPPSPAPGVLEPLRRRRSQIRLLELVYPREELRGSTFQHNAAAVHHVRAVCDLQGKGHVLLDD